MVIRNVIFYLFLFSCYYDILVKVQGSIVPSPPVWVQRNTVIFEYI